MGKAANPTLELRSYKWEIYSDLPFTRYIKMMTFSWFEFEFEFVLNLSKTFLPSTIRSKLLGWRHRQKGFPVSPFAGFFLHELAATASIIKFD